MADYVVTHGIYVDGFAAVQTLTEPLVDVGDSVTVTGAGTKFNGSHTVFSREPFAFTGVDSQGYLQFDYDDPKPNQVIYEHAGHTNDTEYAELDGSLSVPKTCTWIVNSDVTDWLGIDSATANDTAFVTICRQAANDWCYRKRSQAGYTDSLNTVPSNDVKLGTTMYAATLYRERGSVDSFASFDAMALGAGPSMTMGRIMQLLGINRSQVA